MVDSMKVTILLIALSHFQAVIVHMANLFQTGEGVTTVCQVMLGL